MWCCVVWCGVVWCGVVWCDVVCCDVMWCCIVCVVLYGVMWFDVIWCLLLVDGDILLASNSSDATSSLATHPFRTASIPFSAESTL